MLVEGMLISFVSFHSQLFYKSLVDLLHTATLFGSHIVTLKWNKSSDNVGVSGYNVYKEGKIVTTTSDTTYVVSVLSPLTSYTFGVSAIDSAAKKDMDLLIRMFNH